MAKRKKKIISLFARISFVIFVLILILAVLSELSPRFADLINSTVSQQFRRVMATFGDIFPFSLFEIIALSIPLILFLVIYAGLRRFSDREGRLRYIVNILAVVLLVFSGHTLALGIGYRTTPLSVQMSLPDTEITVENLSEVMTSLRDEVNSLANIVPRDENGVFNPEYTYPELSDKIFASYSALESEYGLPANFESNAKGVYFGNFMSYLRIGGIYTYITGEANVNTAYPAYDTIFTAAHEMSHQRGILRENEANFVAYLLTSTSDDRNLRYSAALNMYSYIASALYKTDSDAYYNIAEGLSESARVDIRTSNAVTAKYGDTIIADISEWVNDLYLESNGTDGVVSYSQVVELTVAYFEMKK